MTLHESKPTAYNDLGQHPFGGAHGPGSSPRGAGTTGRPAFGSGSGTSGSETSPASDANGAGGSPRATGSTANDLTVSALSTDAGAGSSAPGSGPGLGYDAGGSGAALGYDTNGSGAATSNPLLSPGGYGAGTKTHPVLLAEGARRTDRALYQHADFGPLRADGDPAAVAGEDFFDLLARLAEPEEWSGPGADTTWALREYVEWTFERLYGQRQIVTAANGAHSVFNTGLVTPHQEAIFGLFTPSRDPDGAPWQLKGWYPESERDLRDRFPELPKAATYAEEPADLVYDWRRELVVSPKNLLAPEENLAALPAPLNTNPYQAGLVLEGAVRRAEARVRRDHRTAVPCWDPAAEEVRLLLPLALTTPDSADTALMVARDDARDAYHGHMLLRLDIAYARARQISRPHNWLTRTAAS